MPWGSTSPPFLTSLRSTNETPTNHCTCRSNPSVHRVKKRPLAWREDIDGAFGCKPNKGRATQSRPAEASLLHLFFSSLFCAIRSPIDQFSQCGPKRAIVARKLVSCRLAGHVWFCFLCHLLVERVHLFCMDRTSQLQNQPSILCCFRAKSKRHKMKVSQATDPHLASQIPREERKQKQEQAIHTQAGYTYSS